MRNDCVESLGKLTHGYYASALAPFIGWPDFFSARVAKERVVTRAGCVISDRIYAVKKKFYVHTQTAGDLPRPPSITSVIVYLLHLPSFFCDHRLAITIIVAIILWGIADLDAHKQRFAVAQDSEGHRMVGFERRVDRG